MWLKSVSSTAEKHIDDKLNSSKIGLMVEESSELSQTIYKTQKRYDLGRMELGLYHIKFHF